MSSQAESLSVCSIKLQILLDEMLTAKSSKNKIMSIGQYIMQAARPLTMIAPLQVCFIKLQIYQTLLICFLKNVQIGLGVQLHSQYSLKFWLSNSMHLDFAHPIPK